MGIKKFNDLIKEYCPDAFMNVSTSFFVGKRIAIDSNEWLYAKGSTIMRSMIESSANPLEPPDRGIIIQKLKDKMVELMTEYIGLNITLVWCWDGTAPAEKAYIRAERSAAKDKIRARVLECKTYIQALNPLAVTPQMLKEYVAAAVQDTWISAKEMEILREMATNMGWPSIQAKGEGEKLASALAVEGLVAAVYSSDTDNYLLGCPLLLTDTDKRDTSGFPTFKVVVLANILVGFSNYCGWQFTLQHLIDLGIMMGTDFNPNIKNIGGKKSLKFLSQCGNIEGFRYAYQQHDTSVLNFVRTREIFAYEHSGCSVKDVICYSAIKEDLRDIFLHHNCFLYFDAFVTKLRNLAHPSTFTAPPQRSRLILS
jgi:5'-3' exonuclease